jgi:hypothetical protein
MKKLIEDNAALLLFFSMINPLFWVAVLLCGIVWVIAFALFLFTRLFALHGRLELLCKDSANEGNGTKKNTFFYRGCKP